MLQQQEQTTLNFELDVSNPTPPTSPATTHLDIQLNTLTHHEEDENYHHHHRPIEAKLMSDLFKDKLIRKFNLNERSWKDLKVDEKMMIMSRTLLLNDQTKELFCRSCGCRNLTHLDTFEASFLTAKNCSIIKNQKEPIDIDFLFEFFGGSYGSVTKWKFELMKVIDEMDIHKTKKFIVHQYLPSHHQEDRSSCPKDSSSQTNTKPITAQQEYWKVREKTL